MYILTHWRSVCSYKIKLKCAPSLSSKLDIERRLG